MGRNDFDAVNPVQEPLEGVGPENQGFFGPCNGKKRSECHLGAKKSGFSGPTHSNAPCNGSARIKTLSPSAI